MHVFTSTDRWRQGEGWVTDCVCVCGNVCVFVIGEGTNARISFRFIDLTHLSPGPCCNTYINIYIYRRRRVCVLLCWWVESSAGAWHQPAITPQCQLYIEHWFYSEKNNSVKHYNISNTHFVHLYFFKLNMFFCLFVCFCFFTGNHYMFLVLNVPFYTMSGICV